MPRIHFYHTVLRENPVSGDVEPLDNVEALAFSVTAVGVEAGTESPVYAARTGATAGENLSDETGVVQFYLDVGDYNIHLSDLNIPARIAPFTVAVNGVSGAPSGILPEQIGLLPTANIPVLTTAHLPPIGLAQLAAALQALLVPTGMIAPFGGSTPPGNSGGHPWPWRACDGTILSRSTYAALFNQIGTSFNLASGEIASGTEFRLPDLRGRVPMGVDGAAAVIAVALDTLGARGGVERHTLSYLESGSPAHGHGNSFDIVAGGSHNHFSNDSAYNMPKSNAGWDQVGAAAGSANTVAKSSGSADISDALVTSTAAAHDHGLTGGVSNSANVNAAQDHQNMQPYQAVNYMIKT
jgi:microcystin-dependent protein